MSQSLFESHPVSPIAEKVEAILLALQTQPGIQQVALSTADGLAVRPASTEATQLAAVAGFLLAAAGQASLMLQLDKPTEMTFQGKQRVVCYPFQVGSFPLILTLVIEAHSTYHHHVTRTIKAISQAMAH